MKKLDIFSLFLLSICFSICFVLSAGHENGVLNILRCFFATVWPYLIVGGAYFLFFKRGGKYVRFALSTTIFALLMTKNVKLTKDLDGVAVMVKECGRINQLSDSKQELLALQETQYPAADFGEYGDFLQFVKKEKLYSSKEFAKRSDIEEVLDFSKLFSEEVLFSAVELEKLRTRLYESYQNLAALERQATNCYTNLFSIFKNKTWEHATLKKELTDHLEKENNLRLNWCDRLYSNIRAQLYAMDDLVVFLHSRQGAFVREDLSLCFKTEMDNSRCSSLVSEIEYLAKAESDIHDQFNKQLAALKQ